MDNVVQSLKYPEKTNKEFLKAMVEWIKALDLPKFYHMKTGLTKYTYWLIENAEEKEYIRKHL